MTTPKERARRGLSSALLAVVGSATFGLLGATVFAPAFAGEIDPAWGLCGDAFSLPPRPPVEGEAPEGDAIKASADDADLSEDAVSTLRGNVQILRGGIQLGADEVRYDRQTDLLDADGNVRLWDEGVFLSGDHAHWNRPADTLTVDNGGYRMEEEHAWGDAEKLEILGSELIRIEDATYTTCNPGQVDWQLKGREIELDRVEEWGSARDVKLEFKGVPIFYSPYMTFPLSDKRKSGFLTPSFRSSGQAGYEMSVPYYWNIAPNHDATVTARGMSDRGVLVRGEYRYLTPRGTGIVGAEYLPHDSMFDGGRGAFSFNHAGKFAPRWDAEVDFNYASDKDYFEDLGTDLDITSTRHLVRRAELRYRANRWWMTGRLQGYQTIDKTIAGVNRPYQRLPQLLFGASRGWGRFNVGMRGEVVRFDRDDSLTGIRTDLKPYVSLPLRSAGAFFVPKVAMRYTRYDLDNSATGIRNDPSRLSPSLSVDSGVFLERDMDLFGNTYLHTLEPRLYYLLVPYDDQSGLPVFDTGRYTFNFSQLFREDRFSGADRVGDAHQVAAALTSRLLDPDSGHELFRVSIGQIRYFRDRKVTLPNRDRQVSRESDIVGEVAAAVARRWRASAGLQWNPDRGRTDKSTISLRYSPDQKRVLNLAYRFVRDTSEQTDVSFRWPITGPWSGVGRWNYALADERTLEAFGGVQYDSCCWAVRAVARRFLSNTAGEFSDSLFLQFELKGLAGIGRKTGELLERGIPGYHNEF